MKFLITNRNRITSLDGLLNQKHIVISMCEPDMNLDFPVLPKNPNRLGVLQLSFADLDNINDAKQVGQAHYLMTQEQADQVVAFVNEHMDSIETIICQCDGGVSRSSGMAAALSKILNGDDSWVFNSKEYVPNRYVYRLIMNAYHDWCTVGLNILL